MPVFLNFVVRNAQTNTQLHLNQIKWRTYAKIIFLILNIQEDCISVLSVTIMRYLNLGTLYRNNVYLMCDFGDFRVHHLQGFPTSKDLKVDGFTMTVLPERQKDH